MNYTVSIIIPAYNTEKYLAECIDSIINQTYTFLEIIIINDGSTDSTGKIADNYAQKDKRIKVIHQKNKGVSLARNRGISIAQGKYICFIDSDDYVSKYFINYLVNDLQTYDIDLVTTNSDNKKNFINDIDKIEVISSEEALVRMFYGKLEKSNNGVQMFKTNLLKINNIRYDVNIKICEDFDFLVQALIHSNNIAVDDRHMYYYRLHSNSTIHQKINNDFFRVIQNKSNRGMKITNKIKGLKSSIEVSIFISSIYLLIKGYEEREKWQNEFQNIFLNINKYKWKTLCNKNAKLKTRLIALLYCLLGNKIATLTLIHLNK